MCKAASLAMPAPELRSRTAPYNADAFDGSLDASQLTSVELMPNEELYALTVDYVSHHASIKNFKLKVGRGSGCCSDDDDDDDDISKREAHRSLGLGRIDFEWEGHKLHALHQTLGEVVGGDCGATMLKNLVLFSAEGIKVIESFANHLLAKADLVRDHTFTIYRWHVQHKYWMREETATARPLDSVVLPAATKQKLVADLDDFVSQGTRKWYASHGIPYKRSLLLFGSPGAGKTSLIQALAGRYKRNLAILTPSHPEMTDDGLKAAVQRVPSKSIIVLEDVDAIFAEGRSKKDSDKSSLTFSGVLNALDGVGASAGQIFILTTNHREKLDPALIRNGRVDCHVEFTDADADQAAELFRQFYSEAEDKVALSEAFAKSLFELIEQRKTSISMAALQHYFIIMRRATAKEAADGVAKILEEAEAHGKLQKEREEAKKEKAEKEEEDGSREKGKEEGKSTGKGNEPPKDSPSIDKQQMHVHVHMH